MALTSGGAALGELLRSLVEAAPDDRIRFTQLVIVDDRASSSADDQVAGAGRAEVLASIGTAWVADITDSVQVVHCPGCSATEALGVALPMLVATWAVVLDESVVVPVEWWSAPWTLVTCA